MSDWKKETKRVVFGDGLDAKDLGGIGLIGCLCLFLPIIIAGLMIALFR